MTLILICIKSKVDIKTTTQMAKNNAKVRSIRQYGGWGRVLNAARMTAGKNAIDKEPSDYWKAKMLLAEHSPIRLLEYDGIVDYIKMWVTTHLVRHHVGVEKFVSTQRVDRNVNRKGFDRDELPQGLENSMMLSMNAQAIINISRKRLCKGCPSKETREAWEAVVDELRKVDSVLADKCVPECIYRGFCPERDPRNPRLDRCCGYCNTRQFEYDLAKCRNIEQYND